MLIHQLDIDLQSWMACCGINEVTDEIIKENEKIVEAKSDGTWDYLEFVVCPFIGLQVRPKFKKNT